MSKLPQSEADRKAIKGAVSEAVASIIRMDAEKDLLKNIKKDVKEKYDISPSLFGKMVNVYVKQNYGEVIANNSEFEDMYAQLFQSNQNG
jgi:hypothetical protein